jgi:hypothetical protein
MSDSSYHGGVPTITIDDAIEIVELCLLASTPNRITEFFACRFTPGEVMERLKATAAPVPAAHAASASIFGGPTDQERDRLTEVVRKRLTAMSAKS